MPTLGQNIKAARAARRVSQQELLRAVGVSQSHMWAIEADKNEPGAHLLQKIAAALGTTMDALMPPLEGRKTDAA